MIGSHPPEKQHLFAKGANVASLHTFQLSIPDCRTHSARVVEKDPVPDELAALLLLDWRPSAEVGSKAVGTPGLLRVLFRSQLGYRYRVFLT